VQALGIILISVVAAVVYGIGHDQVTARICVEYFTIGHPKLIDSESPTVLGLFWGIVATWWVGLPLGVGLAAASRIGKRPKLDARDVVSSILKLICCMYIVAAIAGVVGYGIAKAGQIQLLEPLASEIPAEKHVAFIVDSIIHLASYGSGMIGGVVLWILVWRRRHKLVETGARVP